MGRLLHADTFVIPATVPVLTTPNVPTLLTFQSAGQPRPGHTWTVDRVYAKFTGSMTPTSGVAGELGTLDVDIVSGPVRANIIHYIVTSQTELSATVENDYSGGFQLNWTDTLAFDVTAILTTTFPGPPIPAFSIDGCQLTVRVQGQVN